MSNSHNSTRREDRYRIQLTPTGRALSGPSTRTTTPPQPSFPLDPTPLPPYRESDPAVAVAALIEAADDDHPNRYPLYCHPNGFPRPNILHGYSHPLDARTVILGPHRSEPLYAVAMPAFTRDFSTEVIVLHDGPERSAHALAVATGDGGGGRWAVALFPGPAMGEGPRTEVLEKIVTLGRVVFSFSVETSQGRQVFEWRCSSGAAVRAMKVSSTGWQLVSLEDEARRDEEEEEERREGDEYEDPVAVWSTYGISWTKFFKYGLHRGRHLGERFELMALVTALVMWDWDLRVRMGDS
jgi:hypothetical protein